MAPARGPGRAAARALTSWYRAHARDLPWRRRPDPYHVLVSEVMLQQTTVEAVIPFYRRFMARFPDASTLAAAPTEDLLALWSGLGYYRRARSLQAAAREMVSRHGGGLPRSRRELLELPGVGPYTAAAVLALAHGQEAVALDGNLKRVLARLVAWEGDVETAGARRALEAAGLGLVRAGEPAVINQALMDLGASVCSPRSPRCSRCPLEGRCLARKRGLEDRIPPPRRRPEPVEVRLAAAVLRRDGKLLMLRREGRLMAGLWDFPMIETGRGPEGKEEDGASRLAGHLRAAGLAPGELAPAGEVRHAITRHRIRVALFSGTARGRPSARRRVLAEPRPPRSDLSGAVEGRMMWVEMAGYARLPLTGLARKIGRRSGEVPEPAGAAGRRGVSPPGSGRPSSAR